MALDVTRVRSDMRVHHLMMLHIGATSPLHVYLGIYSGMCVWYDTTSGMDSNFEYRTAANTRSPGLDT